MIKRLFILLFFICMPVFAGSYDDALKGDKNILLYLYTDECSVCQKFSTEFDALSKTYKDIKFVKIDANTKDGLKLMRKYRGYYVPYIVLTSPKTKKSAVIKPYCSLDNLCLQRAIKNFKG